MTGRCVTPSPIASELATIKREGQPRRHTRSTRSVTPAAAASSRSNYQSNHSKRHHPYQTTGSEGLTTPRRPKSSANQNVRAVDRLSPSDKLIGARRRTDKLMTFLQSARERKIPVRSGKWHPEEDAYLSKLIELFSGGLLEGIPPKASMRSWLAKMLNCCPMRISKKQMHGGQFEGKIKYVRNYQRIEALTQAEYDTAWEEIVSLRAEFLMAWAKDELTRRQLREQDSSFEEWYCKVLEIVPFPIIGANSRISTAKRLQQNDSVSQLGKGRVIAGRQFVPRNMPMQPEAQSHMRLRPRAAKRTLGDAMDELVVASTKKHPSSIATSSGLEDKAFIKPEILADSSFGRVLHEGPASQPIAEDNIGEFHYSSFKNSGPVSTPKRAILTLPILHFDLAGSNYAQPPQTNDGQWNLDISAGSTSEITPRDIAAPTERLLCGGAEGQEDIALLASDADVLPLDDFPFDSWLFESLMSLP